MSLVLRPEFHADSDKERISRLYELGFTAESIADCFLCSVKDVQTYSAQTRLENQTSHISKPPVAQAATVKTTAPVETTQLDRRGKRPLPYNLIRLKTIIELQRKGYAHDAIRKQMNVSGNTVMRSLQKAVELGYLPCTDTFSARLSQTNLTISQQKKAEIVATIDKAVADSGQAIPDELATMEKELVPAKLSRTNEEAINNQIFDLRFKYKLTADEIAKRLGVTVDRVWNIVMIDKSPANVALATARDKAVPTKPKALTADDEVEIMRLRNEEHYDAGSIAKELKCDIGEVMRVIRENNGP